MTIGVSTLAFGKLSKEKIVKVAEKDNLTIEFSSSFPYQSGMIEFFESIKIDRFAHNYFPAPKNPFVLNLGSMDTRIRESSIQHCIQGLEISKNCGAHYFSAHAGFCIDPNPRQLGKQLNVNVVIDRTQNWNLFIESINIILLEAKRLNVSFLIENNVTAKFNLRNDDQQVLLCSHPQELLKLVNEIDDSENFGLLLDTAHLKVSSLALNFNLDSAINSLTPFVKYLHHSDNNGERDTNESINSDYWFLKYMNRFKNRIHILEVKNINLTEIEDQLCLLKKAL